MIFYDLASEEFLENFIGDFINEESDNKIQRESENKKGL